jgi:hypothetical protein
MAQSFLDLQNLALHNDFAPATYRALAAQSILDALGKIGRTTQLPANEEVATVSVLAGTSTYQLPAANVRVLEVYDANGSQLSNVGIDALDQHPSTAATVSGYALFAGNIIFWPTPSAPSTISLRYLGTTTGPSLDTDGMAATTGIPEDYLGALVSYARARLFEKEDDGEMAAYWDAQWEKGRAQLRADVQRRDRSRVRRIPGMWQAASVPRFRVP